MPKTIRLLLAALLSCSFSMAQAALLAGDPQWQLLLEQGRTTELSDAARARLATQSQDWNAVTALGLAAAIDGENAGLNAALPGLLRCVDQRPERASCHYVLGLVQGVQAMMGSFRGRVPGGVVRDRFARALELDPTLFEARSSLVDFYLLAPSIAGGSGAKARELAAAIVRQEPERARLLYIKIALNDQDLDRAERELAKLSRAARSSGDGPLREGLLAAWADLGAQFQSEGDFARARSAFEALQRDYPDHAAGFFGLGCLLLEQGQPDEAIRQLDRARTSVGAWRLPVELRLGQAWQAKGERREARLAIERFLSARRGNPRDLRDARQRLMSLGMQ